MKQAHIVQIGYDDSAFSNPENSDYLARQLEYARILKGRNEDGCITNLVLTRKYINKTIQIENLTIISIHARWFWLIWLRLLFFLLGLNKRKPISVISSQTVQEDGWVALIAGGFLHIPVVGQIHYDLFSPHAIRQHFGSSWIGRLRYGMVLKALPAFYKLRVVGSFIEEEVRRRGLNDRVTTLPVAVPLMQEEGGRDKTHAVSQQVLYVGRLSEEKNLMQWLDIAHLVHMEMPSTLFLILGEGSLKVALEKKVDEMGLQDCVTLGGHIAYQQLPDYYRQASVFLLTSHYEGFGRVAVEAGYFELPVVAPHITGIEDIVVDGSTGFLHTPDDVQGMVDSIIKLLKNDHLREALGREARMRVMDIYSPERLERAWVELLLNAGVSR